jgi:hypothetical protein
MDEYVSPIDGHLHYGEAGRAECAVCCLAAERDRHWAGYVKATDAADAAAEAVGAMATKLSAVLAENERLQTGIMSAELHGEMIVRMRESVWRKHETERDLLRSALLDIITITDPQSSVHLIAQGALDGVRSELDDVIEQLDASATGENT